ncbi:GNAT family N-acetyltransferase [Sphingorhabdus pulchriflava]|uniref:GNAT family N-acetyltransferase n=1 Tax=Sphingorhabdus pulchriflava TaxID=2292257 RepID=A0A371BIL2_9SPHN|nr:GNAT family N-acetyltransferase [Sphingorhabdus pulchriflava]RDV07181.1 GNAT family N-acetyltransferase [Sphingorhabdus pulchriflava]
MEAAPITFRNERRPGDDQLIVDLHRLGYAPEGDRFGPPFWDFVAETVAEAQLDQPSRSRVWFAEMDGKAVGCSALVDRGEVGQLRWVVLLPEARGSGAGRKLVDLALHHARSCGHREVFLETTDGLASSMAIYEKVGFETTDAHVERLWHGDGVHVTMTLKL